MQLVLAVLVCLGLTGATVGYRLPYIVNGRDAEVGEFPWQASLQKLGKHWCGAVLVTKHWLVSAAHCVQSSASIYEVVLGAHDIKTREKGDPKTYEVEKVIAHRDFGGRNYSDPDIGLIKLASDATLGTYVDTIPLAAKDVGDLVGADCVITGWGKTEVGATGEANVLQAANTKPLTYAACEALAKDMPRVGPGVINDGHICVGGVNVEGSCFGDSGGPLVCKLADGSKVLAGVTSFGSFYCGVQYPTMYSRISTFRDWLSDNSGGEV